MCEIRGSLNWGYDYDIARALLRKAGVALSKNLPLEFPSGSMFWGRSAAIRPLLDLNLGFEDFPVEAGQIDGTLAHAIERTILMFAESSGHEWLKVARRDLYPLQHTLLEVRSSDDIRQARLKVFRPCLCGVDASARPTALGIEETRPLLSYPSRNSRPRLNLLVPSVNPGHTLLERALAVFSSIADALGTDFDRRIVATDVKIEAEGLSSLPNYTLAPFEPTLDETPCALVDAHERSDGLGRLDLRENDIFLATTWWTADFAGLVTVVNDYAEKTLSKRNPDVISLSRLNGELLASAVEDAVGRAEKMIGRVASRGKVARRPLRWGAAFEAAHMAGLLRGDLTSGQKNSRPPHRRISWWRPRRALS